MCSFLDPSYAGGANDVSLEQARRNFAAFGAKSEPAIKNVRRFPGTSSGEYTDSVQQPMTGILGTRKGNFQQ
jgi:hypothetical protein